MFTFDQVVPWGQSFARISADVCLNRVRFPLEHPRLRRRPGQLQRGGDLWAPESSPRIRSRLGRHRHSGSIAVTFDQILDQTRRNADKFVWDSIRSVEQLGELRMAAMEAFLDDFDRGKVEGRYVPAALPTLPFAGTSFDLALCSHFLFLYSGQLGEAFHLSAIREMCRVATEVRIFPLLALDGTMSPHIDRSVDELCASGCDVSIDDVPYEFQRGGNQMLRIHTRRADR